MKLLGDALIAAAKGQDYDVQINVSFGSFTIDLRPDTVAKLLQERAAAEEARVVAARIATVVANDIGAAIAAASGASLMVPVAGSGPVETEEILEN